MVSHKSEVYHACLRTHAAFAEDDGLYVWNQPAAIAARLGWPLEDAINAEHELTFAGLIHWRWIPRRDGILSNKRVIHVAPMMPTTPPGERSWEIR